MKQELSQQEIDSLIEALRTGEIDSDTMEEEGEIDNVKDYDFKRPVKFSKEYINSLFMIFENFSKITENLLSTQIRSNINIKLGEIDQISYDEFIKSIPHTTLLATFRSKSLGGVQTLEINPAFCVQAINLMCGADDDSLASPANVEKEGFTQIELGILEEIVISILRSFESAWAEVVPELKTELDALETNSQLIQNMSPNEPIILMSFLIEVMGKSSFMNICIPYASFENVMDKLSMKNWFDFDKGTNEDNDGIIEDRIKSCEVDLEVLLGEMSLTIDDFLRLEVGDVIQLDTKITEPLEMYLENKLHYLVRPGQVNSNYAVEILEHLEEGE